MDTCKPTVNTAAFGTALQKYSAVLYCTLLYFSYNWFVIYSQNKMVPDSFSRTGIRHQSINIDICFSFLTGVTRNFSACLSKFGVFIRNWLACFEKPSFLYASSYCTCWTWNRAKLRSKLTSKTHALFTRTHRFTWQKSILLGHMFPCLSPDLA